MSLDEFLIYLSGPAGVSAAVAFLLSFALEWIPGWGSWPSKAKQLVAMLLSFVIPLVAVFLGHALAGGGWWPGEDAVWNALYTGFTSYFANQLAHVTTLPRVVKDSLS